MHMRAHWGVFLLLVSVAGCSCSDRREPAATDAGNDSGPFLHCLAGQFVCVAGDAVECDGMGGRRATTDCDVEGKVCADLLGCVNCQPGARSCSGGIGQYCVSDGSGITSFDCDPEQGMVCDPDGCKGVCAPPEVTESYIGCDYYPTVTLNPVWSGFDFAIAVANASSAEANVVITKGDSEIQRFTLPSNDLDVVTLDWVAELKGGDLDACAQTPPPGNTRLVHDGAYRVRSDRPITVYQLSPLTYEIAPAPEACPVAAECPGAPVGVTMQCLSYSNDASLLLPATSLTGNYTVMSWPSMGPTASFFAVTATQDNTQVRVDGLGSFAAGDGIDADGDGMVTLQRGDVLEVIAAHTNAGPYVFGEDASGSRVQADKPVQVLSGHSCALIPDVATNACDHLEEAIFPSESLGKRYLVTHPTTPGNSPSRHVVRVAAIEEETQVSFDPPVHAPVMLGPGEAPFDLGLVTDDLEITADKPILVAQYMVGQDAAGDFSDGMMGNKVGDPSLSLAVPVEQFRDDYIFTASQTYASNFINVIARSGETVTLDGSAVPLSEFTPIGGSGYSIARHPLATGGSESHHIHGDEPFGLVVYGYGSFTSYMVPGGLDLKRITQVPILE